MLILVVVCATLLTLLRSFLDSGNTALIRWSDDGRSFIVLDEDEFARTLIPELFKHSNYASFVRQLNMYGFHKTVNITDGSLRQSEKARKGVKPPSMYSHPYFRKNRPDLLWLIQKPAGKSTAKRKREGADSDDDSPGPDSKSHGDVGTGGGSDLTSIPRNEMASVRQELSKLQQQQELISRMISHIKSQNEQFYRQATAFQALHDRHENSINAILTFLATFYNRSLDGHAGQNLVNMFSGQTQNNQTHGSVVEEFPEPATSSSSHVQRYTKRPQLLLTGPSASSPHVPTGNLTVEPNSARPSSSPSAAGVKREGRSSMTPQSPGNSGGRRSETPVIKTSASPPNQLPESDQMMSLIKSVNATNANDTSTNTPTFDFSSALDHYQNANGNSPLTPQQRDDMLALINQHGGQGAGSNNENNALVSPNPPAMPDLAHFKQTQQQLEMLTNMQKRQDAKVQDLQRRLQPLSPTGSIPGLQETENANPFDAIGAEYDPNAFLNFDNWNDNSLGLEGAVPSTNPFDPGNYSTDFNWDGYDDSGATDGMFQTTNTTLPLVDRPATDEDGKIENMSSGVPTPNVADQISGGYTGVSQQFAETGESKSSHKRQKTGG
jgi:heat shock transcription factor